MKTLIASACAACVLSSGSARGQIGPEASESTPPGPVTAAPNSSPPSDAMLTPIPAAAEPDAPNTGCTPPCRDGYFCHQGQCLSSCNPPCAPGERCMNGDCVRVATPESVAAPPEGMHQHDGFLLRLAIGFGYGRGTEDGEFLVVDPLLGVTTMSGELEFSGLGMLFNVDLGGSIAENLVLLGRYSGLGIFSPKVSLGGDELQTTSDTRLAFYLFGIGLTYYLMPANVYVTGAIGPAIALLTVQDADTEDSASDFGWAFNVDLGKEWWVGDNWGLGIAARFAYHSVPAQTVTGSDATLTGLGAGALFSATYQ